MKQYVIAPTYTAFKEYCASAGIVTNGAARFISSPDSLRGLRLKRSQVHFAHGWKRMFNAEEIEQQVNLCVVTELWEV